MIEGLSEEECLRPQWKDFVSDGPVHALGISWDPAQDEMRFTVPVMSLSEGITKRKVLSTIAKLFDPLGWLSPHLIRAKILMQELWRRKILWDETLPPDLMKSWTCFCEDLRNIASIRIPRWLGTKADHSLQIHGFADASQQAYAAVLYLRLRSPDGQIKTKLLTSKTRVAPVKTLTIPRLELCAALLLIRLLRKTIQEMERPIESTYAWSDSRTVLTWISAEPSKWSTFVSHRVAEIQANSENTVWNHVSSQENPADLASRGTNFRVLSKSDLWWKGPAWMTHPTLEWPPFDAATEPEESSELDAGGGITCNRLHVEDDLISRFSSLTRWTRVIARCLRFGRARPPQPTSWSSFLQASELQEAFLRCARISQQADFSSEIQLLERGEYLKKGSRLARLSPFLDAEGILRVGGRLHQAPLPYSERHPLILSKECHLSTLILEWAHKTSLHGGAALSYSVAVRKAWIVGGRQRVRHVIHKCVTCIKRRGQVSAQMMGSLPRERVERSRPFSKVGLDYAGPLNVKISRGRGLRSTKGYIAVFVCLSTKAVHLKAVSDLTTSCFLATLRRFSSRRGWPSEIWSDNATTFYGAATELKNMLRSSEIQWELVSDTLANEGVSWRFIPPSAPHFGGLWEAAVKSAKSYLRRVIGAQILTYEELSTLLAQIEFCMNSRPLTPMIGDPDDLQAVTPWHLLTGFPPQVCPEPHLSEPRFNALKHWRLIQNMRDHFWQKWSAEYLNTLQQRTKWTQRHSNIQIGDLVLIKDPSLIRQGRWPLGRVTATRPGRDGLVRVVNIRTAYGNYMRPITKLCALPSPQVDASLSAS